MQRNEIRELHYFPVFRFASYGLPSKQKRPPFGASGSIL
ncbi:hypothetical protein COXBURSA331_A0125 [Coxiella burnetii RSA 331]|nr:hypothetical protein COXBURSA331_A0125 [Coxiella burnetii RSA 331]